MHVAADCDGRVHLEQVGLLAENLCALFYDVQSLLFGQATFAVEMLLEELDIGL